MTGAGGPLRLLLGRVGYGYAPLALVARLPFAMMIVGVLTLVVAARGSIELAGVNSAIAGLGCACLGPLLGAAADRFGQRPVLLIAGTANGLLLGAFAWVAFSALPDPAMLTLAFLIGASTPQISPMSRSRIVTVVAHDVPVVQRPRLLNAALSYESAADEVVFVFGPVLAGLLASTMGAWAPVAGAAVLTLVFVTAFALHRTAASAKSAEERAATLAPASQLARPALLVTVFGIFCVGLFFGSMLTALTAFMQDRDAAERSGLLYGALGVGSAIFALGVAALPPRFSLRARWLAFAAVMVAGALGLQVIGGEGGMVACLVITGCGVGPVLVTLYGFGAHRSPEGRSATVMTMLGSGIMVGQAGAAAATGAVASAHGTAAALLLPLAASVLVLLAGLANWWLTPTGDPRGRR